MLFIIENPYVDQDRYSRCILRCLEWRFETVLSGSKRISIGFHTYAHLCFRLENLYAPLRPNPRLYARIPRSNLRPKPPAAFLFENLRQDSESGLEIWPKLLPREAHQKMSFNATFRILHNTTLYCTSLHPGYRSCSRILRCRAFNCVSNHSTLLPCICGA